ncbi:MAG: hypothetical protein Q9187_002310 [Circinaria calcarea]
MRKKPPGKLLSKTAHQVEREYRIIHALEKTDVPVPKAYALCEDVRVVGTPFYIMEFLDGRIFEDASFPGVSPEERREMWYDAIRTLAKLHRVDPRSVGLSDFGKPSGFYNRQLKTLGMISESQAQAVDIESKLPVGKIPHFDDMVSFFKDPNTQPQDRGTLIHGDYKIDNLVYHKSEPKVIGILEYVLRPLSHVPSLPPGKKPNQPSWEMSTIGHPLSDLSNLLTPFTFSLSLSGPSLTSQIHNRINPAFSSANTPGLPSRSQCIAWYAETAGWDPSAESLWGDAFGVFKNSVIMQGIAARYALRQASSAKAREYGEQMRPFGEFAAGLVKALTQRGQGGGEKAKL